jgi:nitroreductase
MDFIDLMARRYSARAFLPTPVPQETIRRILDTAQRTPSWCNTQPWQVMVTTTPAATERFREALWARVQSGAPAAPDYPFPPEYVGEHRERRKHCGVALYSALGITREDKAGAAEQTLRNFRLFDAPHVALVLCHQSLGFYGGVDCGLYIQSFMLAALNEGVHSIAQAALAMHPQFVREYFGVSDDYRLLFGCSFGYADQSHPVNGFRTERAAIEENVRFIDA